MDAEAKGLTVEDLTLGQAPSPEALVARFVGEGILHLAEDGTLWRLKRKVGGHRGPRYQSVRPERADREMPNGRTQVQVWVDGVRYVCATSRLRSFLREETHS